MDGVPTLPVILKRRSSDRVGIDSRVGIEGNAIQATQVDNRLFAAIAQREPVYQRTSTEVDWPVAGQDWLSHRQASHGHGNTRWHRGAFGLSPTKRRISSKGIILGLSQPALGVPVASIGTAPVYNRSPLGQRYQ